MRSCVSATFEPLGMKDTGFFVPPDKLGRYAGCGIFTDQGKKMRMDEDGAQSAYAKPPVFPAGDAGLVSTVDDYLIFACVERRQARQQTNSSRRVGTRDDAGSPHARAEIGLDEEFLARLLRHARMGLRPCDFHARCHLEGSGTLRLVWRLRNRLHR